MCAYCGEIKPSSKDHVIPRCLFPRPLPNPMITVPACDDCNGAKSRHDDFLRDLLVTDYAGSGSPIAQELFQTKTIRSHQQRKSLLGRITEGRELYIPVRASNGKPDTAVLFSIDFERAIEMYSFLVRGLYFHFHSVRLPNNCNFRIGRPDKADLDIWIKMFNSQGGANVRRIGNGEVFACAYNFGANEKFATLWLLEFYGRVHVAVITTPDGFLSNLKTDS